LHQSCTYLKDEGVVVDGVRIWGTPWQPFFFDWAFQAPRDSDELRSKWRMIPPTDILVVHGPPYGIGDKCVSGLHAGDPGLLEEIQGRIRPQLVISGHIHEDKGARVEEGVLYVNASSIDVPKPVIVVDLVPR